MPLLGGTSDKFGNRYEGKWTVLQIIRILRERAITICLEPPIEHGFEFAIKGNGFIEYHQVKRQHSATGRWVLSDLQGVLGYFKSKLAEPETSCVFVSTNSAYQLEELSDRSRRAGSYERFNKEFLPDTSKNVTSSSNWRSMFKQLCEMWDLTNEPEIAHNFLTKIQVKTIDEYTLSDRIINEIEPLITGTPVSICSVLAQFVLENINRELNSQDIWSHLEKEHGLKKNAWADNQLLHGIITQLLTQFTDPLAREVILQKLISSASTSNIVEKIKNSKHGMQGVLVVGEAGVGKSCVILEVVQSLCNENWLVLPIRVSTLNPVRSPKELGEQLGLPGSPAQVLSEMAGERPALLVVDQLDALSLISGRNPDFFDCFEALFRETANVSTLRLLVACRKYDLENDHRFRQLSGNQGILEEVKVGKLNKETVLDIVEKIGLSSSKLKERQIDLLSLPIHLKLLSQVANDQNRNPLEFNTAKELFDHFWDFKQQLLRERLKTKVNWIAVIDILCEKNEYQTGIISSKAFFR